MERKIVWRINFQNYTGEDFYYDFDNEPAARATFENICDAHKDYDEFVRSHTVAAWYDSNYNDMTTRITISKIDLFKYLFSHPISVDEL